MITKILVATDGSDNAANAIKYDIEFASKWDAQLLVLSVIPTPTHFIFDEDGFDPKYLRV